MFAISVERKVDFLIEALGGVHGNKKKVHTI
jgi:hypothetical protein